MTYPKNVERAGNARHVWCKFVLSGILFGFILIVGFASLTGIWLFFSGYGFLRCCSIDCLISVGRTISFSHRSEMYFVGIIGATVLGRFKGKFTRILFGKGSNGNDKSVKSTQTIINNLMINVQKKMNNIEEMVEKRGSHGLNSQSYKKEISYIRDHMKNIRYDPNDLRSSGNALSSYLDIHSELNRLERKLGLGKDLGKSVGSIGIEKNETEKEFSGYSSLFSLGPSDKNNDDDSMEISLPADRKPSTSTEEEDTDDHEDVYRIGTDKEGAGEGTQDEDIRITPRSDANRSSSDDNETSAPSTSYARFLEPKKGNPVPSNIKKILPKYMIDREIRSGEFSNLYYGNDDEEQDVAIKMPSTRRKKIWPPSALWEFLFDVDRWRLLKHENIVTMHESSLEPLPHIVMERMEGGDLAGLMKNHDLSISEATHITLQLLKAASYAHEKGAVHRDLKPTNILFNNKGMPKISDWGWGNYLKEAVGVTKRGHKEILGYCAPEQINPGKFGKVDSSTDIFQLGVIYYEMLTGRNPFMAEQPSKTMSRILGNDVEPPSSFNSKIPGKLDDILMKALRKDKKERWSNGEEMYTGLNEVKERYLGPV